MKKRHLSDFSIGQADLFFDDTIPKRRFEELNALARKIEIREEAPRSLVFVREVPAYCARRLWCRCHRSAERPLLVSKVRQM